MCEGPTNFTDAKDIKEPLGGSNGKRNASTPDEKTPGTSLIHQVEPKSFKIKYKADRSIERYKARLVVKGFQHRAAFDYAVTFSLVVKFDSIRFLLTLAAAKNMHTKRFAIGMAFLYGELGEDRYMMQHEGFNDGSGKVCQLKESLYELKQAPKC